MWCHTVTHGRGSEGGNWRMQWVASTLHTTSEHGVSSITTADEHTSAASNRLNWRHPPADLNGHVRFARKTKSGFCACDITFQLASTAGCRKFCSQQNGYCKRIFGEVQICSTLLLFVANIRSYFSQYLACIEGRSEKQALPVHF